MLLRKAGHATPRPPRLSEAQCGEGPRENRCPAPKLGRTLQWSRSTVRTIRREGSLACSRLRPWHRCWFGCHMVASYPRIRPDVFCPLGFKPLPSSRQKLRNYFASFCFREYRPCEGDPVPFPTRISTEWL